MFKARVMFLSLSIGAVATLVGCSSGTAIPPKLEVRDTGSGRTYHTYEPWGQVEKGVGYSFTDSDTGSKVTLTGYEVKTMEAAKTVASDSPEATAFKESKTRGGVK
jgi:hypothetical protein